MGNQHLSLSPPLYSDQIQPNQTARLVVVVVVVVIIIIILTTPQTKYIYKVHTCIHTTLSPTIEKKKTIHASNLSYLARYASSSF